ncbi:MAG: ABC transporter ATP-binding protein [Acidimicrobiia bacterium]|nr:ABC transporter ATP-binding protein [Acidimicrobiia bacterium]
MIGVGETASPAQTEAAGVLIELEEVTRTYGETVLVHALNQVSLRIHSGDFMSIVGPSGSGKSTMLGLLGILDLPTSGRISVGGTDVSTLGDYQRSRLRGDFVGFVFQQFHLVPHLTAQGNVEAALLYRGLSVSARRERAREALDRVGLAHRSDHRPIQMSGGEQQRVALARAIVTEPRMVLADEPTGALDTANAANVIQILEDLVTPDTAVVIVTHDREVAAHAARRVSMLDGHIADDHRAVPGTPLGPPATLVRSGGGSA